MGKLVTRHYVMPASLSFTKRGSFYRASIPLKDLALLQGDPAEVMSKATAIYGRALFDIGEWRRQANLARQNRKPLLARKAWELGDIIQKLNEDLDITGCLLEKLHSHLKRHAGLSSYRSSRCLTFRRCINDIDAIPVDLKWSRVEKSVQASAQAIAEGAYGIPN